MILYDILKGRCKPGILSFLYTISQCTSLIICLLYDRYICETGINQQNLVLKVCVYFMCNISCSCSSQDPFGEKRGRFDYQGLLARLGATQRRLREKCPPEDNDGDSDSDTSSSGTDPDSQGSSQPQSAPNRHRESMRKQWSFLHLWTLFKKKTARSTEVLESADQHKISLGVFLFCFYWFVSPLLL